MAINRKLGRTTDIRKAMLKGQLTDLILHGKIETTEARAKEVKAMADSIISLAVKEKDNFEMVDVKVVKAKLDSKGNKVKNWKQKILTWNNFEKGGTNGKTTNDTGQYKGIDLSTNRAKWNGKEIDDTGLI